MVLGGARTGVNITDKGYSVHTAGDYDQQK